jgi:hypothetical protein
MRVSLSAVDQTLPTDTRSAMNEGVAAFKAAKYPEAVRLFQNAIAASPNGDSGEAERLFRSEAERHSGMIPNTIGA